MNVQLAKIKPAGIAALLLFTALIPLPLAAATLVWVEDAVPAGATLVGQADGWNWVSANPAPYSGTLAHQSALLSGTHQHYFLNGTTTLPVAVGDTLFAYVYLDPANPPSEVMLQWNDGSWEQRAYWGANLISWGTDGTDSRRYMGPLPAVGQWVQLAVPAAQVGLEGSTLNGMAYTLYDGRATWDYAGKTTATTVYQVSGTVTLSGSGLNGVNFTATDGGTCTASNTAGTYACTVPQGWSGTVTPSLSGYTFTPSSRVYSGVATNQVAQDYAAGAAPPPSGIAFTSVESTSAPNGTVPVDAWVVGNSASDVDLGIIPKGTGAILAQIPDSTPAGGSKRGAFATDFQRSRLYSTNVASGTGATISGGANSEASGVYATVVGGYDNEASGNQSVVGGYSSIASGVGSVALGYAAMASGDTSTALGHTAVASGTDSVSLGHDNVASRDNSIAIGWSSVSDATQAVALGTQATTRGIHGGLVYAGGWIVKRGDAQIGTYILRVQTFNAIPTTLTTDAANPSLSRQNILVLPDRASYAFSGRLVARDLTTGDSAVWKFEGMAKRGNGAATVTQTSTITPVAGDTGAVTWSFAVASDTGNGGLALVGTGQAGKTIQWVASVETVENVGP